MSGTGNDRANRSPKRTRNGAAAIETAINRFAKADNSGVISPPCCAATNSTKPNSPHWASARESRIASLQTAYPGVELVKLGREWRVAIPEALRTRHEAHFAELTRDFLYHVEQRQPLPGWEKPNALAKYYVCTEGVALSQG